MKVSGEQIKSHTNLSSRQYELRYDEQKLKLGISVLRFDMRNSFQLVTREPSQQAYFRRWLPWQDDVRTFLEDAEKEIDKDIPEGFSCPECDSIMYPTDGHDRSER